ncbi:immunity 52 family protein [Paraburkholderia sp. BR13439]|uniref:immunity 52 family protein n=1 Tax=Paraburkholderia TaxID=1822464 RepID=UPI001FE42576|nr:immunity 52 family protein [Paraburkholderia youngii]
MHLFSQHRDKSGIRRGDFEFHLRRLRRIIERLANKDETLGGSWYLSADSISESLQRPVFANSEPSATALALLSKEYDGREKDPKSVLCWNGQQSVYHNALISVSFDSGELSDIFEISLGEKSDDSSRLGLYDAIGEFVSEVAIIYEALYVTFGPRAYQDQQVFDDRLGVSWMLYLPHVLTQAQVPEARALIPVMREDKQQGTIIVSVTDDVFDVNNRDHVKASNDIEIRLADQDLLPRFVDL